MVIELIRHGYKNNAPGTHQTGVEALLDPTKTYLIKKYARDFAARFSGGKIEINHTPVSRSRATAEIVYATLSESPNLQGYLSTPAINELIGSFSMDLQGNPVNLVPKTMSRIWAEAKKDEVKGTAAENCSLEAWIKEGFFNIKAKNLSDPGITTAEIAWRIGSYFESKLAQITERGTSINTIALGHSGDIEPWLYLTLAMEEGKDIEDTNTLLERFSHTGKALEPLTGVILSYHPVKGLVVTHFGKSKERIETMIGQDIIHQQAMWFVSFGRSAEVLKHKLANTHQVV